MNLNYWKYDRSFELEAGGVLDGFALAYHTYGELNEAKDNVVWAFHALTANSDVLDWWKGLFGEDDLFNPKEHFIICVNVLGSPYGSTAPEGLDFPLFTVRDVVKSQLLLAEALGIHQIEVAIGGSFGGSQALEFAHSFEGKIENLVLVACAAEETAWGKAIHHAQRLALQADETFGKQGGGKKGLKAARAIGMLTYRTAEAFIKTQTDDIGQLDHFKAASYIDYQGDKLVGRFTALSYYYLHKCLDSHHIGRDRGGVEKALSGIHVKTLVIGIDTDRLLPPNLQQQIAHYLPRGTYQEIQSEYGHDGFLIETKQLTTIIQEFIKTGK